MTYRSSADSANHHHSPAMTLITNWYFCAGTAIDLQAWASSPDVYTSSTKIESIRVKYRVRKCVLDFTWCFFEIYGRELRVNLDLFDLLILFDLIWRTRAVDYFFTTRTRKNWVSSAGLPKKLAHGWWVETKCSARIWKIIKASHCVIIKWKFVLN